MAKRTQAHDAPPGTQQAVDHIWEDLEGLEEKLARFEERMEARQDEPEPEEVRPPSLVQRVIDEDVEFNGDVDFGGTVSGVSIGGTVSLPGIHLDGDTASGLYDIGDDNIGITVNGEKILGITETPNNKWMYLWDGDETNYETMAFQKNDSANGYILMRAGGTGTPRNLHIGSHGGVGGLFLRSGSTVKWVLNSDGHLYPYVSDSYDIGTSTYKVRHIYIDETYDGQDGQIYGLFETHGCAWHDINGISNTNHFCCFWHAPYDVEVIQMAAYKLGGTSVTVNVYVDDASGGPGFLRSTAFVLTVDNSWTGVGTLQNTTIDASSAGAQRFLGKISATSGTVTDVSIQILVKRRV